ncbi:hypothetical protein NADFUDRAFT_39863 [Nadsonia fulvescens var. elongata DSM 6958]|uniref:S-adenosyl-L-methionine-dependent tRNA 4-demethylwyosine synthase n=1 Tax=Nadsonia fulvescens var. elongata DSM 6958 TaxID=857566 RepID=A0A1E3PUG5_9ASCO|nr:hypothetical protein NADFUDRAFT_39863 [Nadsonia fulvescens var. elongata DSM 6958]
MVHSWHKSRSTVLTVGAVLGSLYYLYTTKPELFNNALQAYQTLTNNNNQSYHKAVKPIPDEVENNVEEKINPSTAVPMPVDFTTLGKANSTAAVPLKKRAPKKFTSKNSKAQANNCNSNYAVPSVDSDVIVFYSTLTGTSERYANLLHMKLKEVLTKEPELINIDYIEDLDEYFVAPKRENIVYLFVVPSYENESPLDFFLETLKETYNDWRIDSTPLAKLGGYAVFGLGDSENWPEEDKFCYQAIQTDKWLGKLGARRIFPVGTGCIKTDAEQVLEEWVLHLANTLKDKNIPEMMDIVDSDDEGTDEEAEAEDNAVVDVEDMGAIIKRTKESNEDVKKQMVAKDSPTYNSLTKQGYTVVGSHSGVKICRWTKSALRGRGSCYKFAFYGIKSHLCMETTPSLSCSSKCVFCWRHGTNPVGTTWRWQVDPPKAILDGAMEGHYKKIKQLRGVPGVNSARFAEAMTVKHCALSLVGEPIFYPHINEFVGMLHEKHISSFLVCNAQHPDELAAMDQVTQLYVSIDAGKKESLKKVDRPLHRDFWERFQQCLEILREKRNQRTVFRLTLVKDFNTEEIEDYADLVEKGIPCLIEVKGVTYCGTSKGNPLTMKNVPFYEEVKTFVERLNEALNKRGLAYGIAAEHAHSCCILLAQDRFKIDGVWNTHIDYAKFFELLESGKEFGPIDYVAPTPEWAVYGAEAGGFNPEDTRFRRKTKHNLALAEQERLAQEAKDQAEEKVNSIEEKTTEAVEIVDEEPMEVEFF